MDLSLASLLWSKLGWMGALFVVVYVGVTFVGSLVDGAQFIWLWKRAKKRRERQYREKVKAELLGEMFKAGKVKPDAQG